MGLSPTGAVDFSLNKNLRQVLLSCVVLLYRCLIYSLILRHSVWDLEEKNRDRTSLIVHL